MHAIGSSVLIDHPVLITTSAGQVSLFCSGGYLWFLLMSSLPHKEERFLFIIYHIICVASAYFLAETAYTIKSLLVPCADSNGSDEAKPHRPSFPPVSRHRKTLAYLVEAFCHGILPLIFVILCTSRTTMVINGYSAPFRVYHSLYQHVQQDASKASLVCVGKGTPRD